MKKGTRFCTLFQQYVHVYARTRTHTHTAKLYIYTPNKMRWT